MTAENGDLFATMGGKGRVDVPGMCRFCDNLRAGACLLHGQVPADLDACPDRRVNNHAAPRRPRPTRHPRAGR